ncbi:2-hydroxyacid dehydrogenase [Methylobacterium aquaticum]|uniref:2-hydroxyacid dehydrogenase n=1 Tax=Methylobacterium aquaticum TaxID=270351 RepID=A0A0J6VIC7_9HYPH|nr:glyoxylate/hydroxypyruvate reductase A [Methylobacterium aquaticum]KMO38861.1 2-hydroxyacid dehydrogenase [Methylobacterium aquaticum]
MSETIAFLGTLDAEEEADFLAALAAALPEETIRPFRTLSAEERAAIRIAIVANPDPAEVALLPNLAWIHSLWAGVERLVRDLGGNGVPIVRLIDPELARTMAEAVLAWTYYLQRDMPAYRRQQETGTWRQLAYRPPGETMVGLLGLGALGSAAAERLVGAGFRVAAWSRSPKPVPPGVAGVSGPEGLAGLLATSDVVVCLLPLTGETRGLLDAGRLFAMKPGAALINFGRGPLVAIDALLAALDAGHLSHAVLDVFEVEPLPPGSPLWRHPGVTVLPHISGPTTPASSAGIVAGNVRAYRATGRIPQAVDVARGY